MKTSVIIPNYNYGQYLPYSIDSVLNQSESVDEVIVVDDGSTDNSREVLENYGDRIKTIFQPNAGQASAFNTGLAEASGDIIFLLDADDLFKPHKVRTIKKLFANHPEINWIFHDMELVSQDDPKNLETGTNSQLEYSVIDKRQMLKNGKLDYIAPATSGLCFRKNLADIIFPLPTADSIYISDHYIKFLAISESKGLHVDTELGFQLIHENNLYTGKKDHFKKARLFINTAYHLKQKKPSISAYCDNLYTEGLTSYSKAGEPEELETLIKNYNETMGLLEKAKTGLKYRIKKSRLA